MPRPKSKRSGEERPYNIGDKVLSVENGKPYEARIMRKVSIGSNFKYFIHYLKWKRKFDCWIDESLIAHKDDEEKLDQLQSLFNSNKGKPTSSITNTALAKHDSDANNLEGVGTRDLSKRLLDKSSNNLSSPAVDNDGPADSNSSTRKRLAESNSGDSNAVDSAAMRKHRKHLLSLELIDEDDLPNAYRIDIPNLLKKQLVDEYSMIITQSPSRLLRLPKADHANVKSVLSDYLDEKRCKLSADATQLLLLEDLFRGLERYFDKALPAILLYRQERAQFDLLCEALPDRSPSEVYGAEHLLRFYVRLPKLLSNVFMPEPDLNPILSNLNDLLKYLNKHLSKYTDPSNYVEVEEAPEIIKVDPTWGFCEFPEPGNVKKHILEILVDYESLPADTEKDKIIRHEAIEVPQKQFWMPDRYCKVCYACEEAFTMYRRRHHCRMCGQIFCNSCSSHYIDGKLFNAVGLVRSCKLCYDQQNEQSAHDNNEGRQHHRSRGTAVEDKGRSRRDSVDLSSSIAMNSTSGSASDASEIASRQGSPNTLLQDRATQHLVAIVDRLMSNAGHKIPNKAAWKELIVQLVRDVVSSVDPDVRYGKDSMDIRSYVKIKIIPGGSIDESKYVDGLVFKKNVSHRKMGAYASKVDPRIMLIADGIEFQRTDMKLSSMDTLIEQEDKHMEIAVSKIMSLHPNVILVGKSIGRKAQELLCEHDVVVMQNVKMSILEKVGRMTNAMLLPSTDHMIKQYGEKCLGSCAKVWLRLIQDDPEKTATLPPSRILKTRISRGSTYTYIQGCPAERGCSIVLRGDERVVLTELKRIIRFSVAVAYHLRLEVAYYNDRCAILPPSMDEERYEDGSDIDDCIEDVPYDPQSDTDSNSSSSSSSLSVESRATKLIRSRRERYLLSTSLDIDISMPFTRELVGTNCYSMNKFKHYFTSIENHQTLLVTSLLMGESSSSSSGGSNGNNVVHVQKTSADVKGIRYYTQQDIALGQFIMDNCFQLNLKDSKILDHTLSFIHRTGRLDITIHRHGVPDDSLVSSLDYITLPTFMSSFCKECKANVTPVKQMSEETWKMSFGKFLEINFYNRSAICYTGGCFHRLRDDHVLIIQCEWYTAEFEFVPLHPYALHVRQTMEFPNEFHVNTAVSLLKQLPSKHSQLIDDFRLAMTVLEREIKDLLSTRPADLMLAITDVEHMEHELNACSIKFYEEMLRTVNNIPQSYRYFDNDFESELSQKLSVVKSYGKLRLSQDDFGTSVTVESSVATAIADRPDDVIPTAHVVSSSPFPSSSIALHSSRNMNDFSLKSKDYPVANILPSLDHSSMVSYPDPRAGEHRGVASHDTTTTNAASTAASASVVISSPLSSSSESAVVVVDFDETIALHYPYYHMRNTYLRASQWNSRMNTIYKFLESVKQIMLQQQMQSLQQNQMSHTTASANIPIFSAIHAIADAAEAEHFIDEYNANRNQLAELLHRDSGIQSNGLLAVSSSPSTGGDYSTAQLSSSAATTTTTTISTSRVLSSSAEAIPSQHASALLSSEHPYAIAHEGAAMKAPDPLAVKKDNREVGGKTLDKMSRITKALTRFLVSGSKEVQEQTTKFLVPLEDFISHRMGLKPGRRGEVIPVNEDQVSTIIAYSLVSEEYHQELQLHLSSESDVFFSNYKPYRSPSNTTKKGGTDSSMSTPDQSSGSIGSSTDMAKMSSVIKRKVASVGKALSIIPEKVEDVEEEQTPGADREDDDDDEDDEEEDEEDEEELDCEIDQDICDLEFQNNHLHDVKTQFTPVRRMSPTRSPVKRTAQTPLAKAFSSSSSKRDIVDDLPVRTNLDRRFTAFSAALQSNKNNFFDINNRAQESSEFEVPNPPDATLLQGGLVQDSPQVEARVNQYPSLDLSESKGDNASTSGFDADDSKVPGIRLLSTTSTMKERSLNEKQMLSQDKSYIRHRFDDLDEKGTVLCKFQCQTFWSIQFEALRQCYFQGEDSSCFVRSLAASKDWCAQGGKSGAAFSKTSDDRFVSKCISKVELQMFLEFAPAYFEYMAKIYYHDLPSVLCKILGVYTIRYDNKESGRKLVENVVVMENIFYQRNITRTFDLKGSSRARYIDLEGSKPDDIDKAITKRRHARRYDNSDYLCEAESVSQVLLDDNLMEWTNGRPFPLKHRAKLFFQQAVHNDTLFLSVVNVVDYSILVGLDENSHEMVVGIIDYLRQYDFIKKMERMGKSVAMIAGQAAPTIIQPSQYLKRFTLAMERYFMTIPDKWISHEA